MIEVAGAFESSGFPEVTHSSIDLDAAPLTLSGPAPTAPSPMVPVCLEAPALVCLRAQLDVFESQARFAAHYMTHHAAALSAAPSLNSGFRATLHPSLLPRLTSGRHGIRLLDDFEATLMCVLDADGRLTLPSRSVPELCLCALRSLHLGVVNSTAPAGCVCCWC